MKCLIILFLGLIFILACNKDEQIQTSLNNDYKVLTLHKYTLEPISNITINLIKDSWYSAQGFERLYYDTIHTDINGEVTIKTKFDLVNHSSNIFYFFEHIYPKTKFDSGSNEFKYSNITGQIVNNNKIDLLVKPACGISIYVDEQIRNNLKIDSLIVISYSNDTTWMRSPPFETNVDADCNRVNKISWYYFSQKIKSKKYEKDIYVPFSENTKGINYSLDF